MKESYFHCEWAIHWEERENIIKIIFQIHLDNDEQKQLIDSHGKSLNSQRFVYEMEVALYNSRVLKVGGERYLTAIPVDDIEGVAYGEIVTVVKYLKQLTSSAKLKWIEFLQDREVDQFRISWDHSEYAEIRENLINDYRYSHSTVYFPSQSLTK